MIRKGDKIIAIDNIDYIDKTETVSITLGKYYDVIETYYDDHFSCVLIIDDKNYTQRYLMTRFISLSDKREEILNTILT